MRVLLDSHAFLWLVTDAPNLSAKAKALFLDAENRIFLSADEILSEYGVERLW